MLLTVGATPAADPGYKMVKKIYMGGEFPDVINAAFCDGSVHTIEKKKIDDKVLRWLILRNSGQNKSLP